MDERRQDVRGKVIYGAVATSDETGATECIVRNISDHGARLELKGAGRMPKDRIALAIARQSRSVLARIVWWRDNLVGVAFSDPPAESDLAERLRKSEKKKRQLQKQIKDLIGQD